MVPQMSAPPGLHEISVSLTIASDPDGPLAGLLASAAYTPSKTALNALTAGPDRTNGGPDAMSHLAGPPRRTG